MSNSRAARGVAVPLVEALGVLKGSTAFIASAVAITAVGVIAIGSIAARSAQPLALTLLTSLAALGLFFVLGVLAGHIRITGRVTPADTARAVVEAFDEAVQLTTRDGRVLFANRAMLAMAADGDVQRSVELLFTGQSAAEEATYRLLRAAEQGEPHVEEFEVARVPGKPVGGRGAMRVSVTPVGAALAGETGRHVLWRFVDISEARRHEAEEREFGDALISAYDALPVGLLMADADGRLLHANATVDDWLGIEVTLGNPGEVKLADIATPESLALLTGDTAGGTTRLDVELVAAGGKSLPVTALADKSADGRLSVVLLPRSVMTTPGREPSDSVGKRLFQAAPIGIATLDAEGRVLAANGAFTRLLLLTTIAERAPALDLLARPADAEARKAVSASLEAALAGKASVPLAEISVGAKGEFSRRVFMRPLPSASGPEAVILYLVDATEQRALEEKYAQSQKMEAVGKLAGGIAHDFNNVLTAIIGWSDLLLGTQRPGDPGFQNIMNIKSSANRAAGLVNQLLAFSRRQTLQPEVLQLGEVLTDLSVLLNRLLGEKIELKIHQGRDLWHVKADRTQFGQVMINLAVNARDAMPNGGSLLIRTRNITEREALKLDTQGVAITAGEYVLVEVEDSGVGMEPAVLAKIFEPFFTTKGVGKGTGLGLSTVYGIVRQTGGYVFADSTPGKGTTFRVYLPRHIVEPEEEAQSGKPARGKAPAKDLTGRGRVLLVEDEDAVRSFAVEALKRQGYEVVEACSGAEALELMATIGGKVDIVVSDVIMPEMDGPTMLRELRKTDPDIKIVFMSGYPDDAFKNNLEPDAKFAFLPKPFSLAQLAAKVKDELAR